jgi:Domain of unknown function (DUF6438)
MPMRRSLEAALAAAALTVALVTFGCGKVSVATESQPPAGTATVAEGGATLGTTSLGKDRSQAADTKGTVVKLERTECYGTCPAYSVEIHGDGSVEYEGKAYVGKKGKQRAQIAPAALVALAARFEKAGFFHLDWADPCDLVATDHPTAKLTFTTGLRTRTIEDYHGNGCMPKVLRELEDEVDRVGGTARWVGCNARAGAELGDCPR